MFKYFYLISFISFCLEGCNSLRAVEANNDLLTARELNPYGRYIMNDKSELELISSGVHFGFSFQGKECLLYATNFSGEGHNYLQYVLDGVYKARIRINGNNQPPVRLTATESGRHTAWIYKATEAHTGAIVVQKVTGEALAPLKQPSLPLIEFIGNSITCGAAADDSGIPCGKGVYHDQHNAYYSYGPRVARALGTEFILSSVSGIGVYRNWNSDGPSMPEVFENTDFRANSSSPWDFKKYDPKIVSIALGTNDFSNGDGTKSRLPFDSARFVTGYIAFVQLVKRKYPNSLIALLSSPMVQGTRRITLQNCISDVKRSVDLLYPNARPVVTYFFRAMQARGCSGHPSVEDHALLAEELIPFFKGYLK